DRQAGHEGRGDRADRVRQGTHLPAVDAHQRLLQPGLPGRQLRRHGPYRLTGQTDPQQTEKAGESVAARPERSPAGHRRTPWSYSSSGGTSLRAGDGNRTRMTSLEGWSSTIELRPQQPPNHRLTPVAYRLPRHRRESRAPRGGPSGIVAVTGQREYSTEETRSTWRKQRRRSA